MKQETLAAVPRGDFNHIYESGKLSGEVKVLKWGAAISITVMFAYLTIVSQQISDLRTSLERQVSEVRDQTNALKEGQGIIRERLGVIEQRLTSMDQRITANKQSLITHSHSHL